MDTFICEQCYQEFPESELEFLDIGNHTRELCAECKLAYLDSYADSENELDFEQ